LLSEVLRKHGENRLWPDVSSKLRRGSGPGSLENEQCESTFTTKS
jgi:hypothetical protein